MIASVQAPLRSAFTLIEMLAVIAIMAMIASVGALSLSGADSAGRLFQASNELKEMDARARLHARAGGERVVMSMDMEHGAVRLTSSASADQLLRTWEVPKGTYIGLRDEQGADLRAIVFDRLGRSIDYRVVVKVDETSRIHRVIGLTGYITNAEDEQGGAS